jgi:integrase
MYSNDIWTKKKRWPVGLVQYTRSGQYYARVRYLGKLYRRKLGTDDFEYAKRKLSEFKQDLERTDHTKGNTSFGAVLDDYAATLNGAESAVEKKRSLIEKIKATFFGASSLPLRTVKPSQLETWLSKHYGSFSASAYNSALTLIRQALELAVRDRIIIENPVGHLKYRKRPKPIRLTPTFEQFQEIVASVRAQPFNADAQDSGDFLQAMGLLGLGRAELSTLRRRDVDLGRGQIIVYRHKTAQGFAIPIYPQVGALIQKLCEGKAHDARVFKISDGKKALAGACRRLGYPPFSQRSLRRMFITRALERGVDVKVVAQWQGHTDGGKLILDTYSHVKRAHSHRMAQLMTDGLPPENLVPFAVGISR